MLRETEATTLARFLKESFSRVSDTIAQRICEAAKLSGRCNPRRLSRQEAEALFQAIQQTRIPPPATDCVWPIGEELLLRALHQMVPAEFYAAATRPPAVYRGNPFIVEVALAYGGTPPIQRISRETMEELLSETDARTLRQFLAATFDGMGAMAADKILQEAQLPRRIMPGNLDEDQRNRLYEAIRNVNLFEGQTMNVLRYANRVPLLFQAGACAITQTVMQTNWRIYGLEQARGALPTGPVTLMVHIASVWVPFTSESKEAIAAYPEIQKELRLAFQTVGRKLGMFLRRRQRAQHEGQRRTLFLRYLNEVATAVSMITPVDREKLYEKLVSVAKRKTAEADLQLDEHGRPVNPEPTAEDYGGGVLVVDPEQLAPQPEVVAPSATQPQEST
jgi:DNA topoisomerase-6 subunit B